ncbi:MAG: hypothetical protein EHM72_03195 [Calditrichaeota bacterium]|nr:MAG: hypothetical protein EHM72_03195 [Calditrichota bacterium]
MKYLMIILMMVVNDLAAQIKLSGMVIDSNTKRPISNVNVFLAESDIGTTTDVSGKFILDLAATQRQGHIILQHISYKPRTIQVDSLPSIKMIELIPRVIPLSGVEVVGVGENRQLEIQRDLPMRISVLNSETYDIRGYADVGDVLKTDSGIQINEEMSGKKSISLRAGNSDDLLFLYDGVRLNSPFDNSFDLSVINLDPIERLEIIKGSNTTIYGPEAFSGVINIKPQNIGDHLLRAKYRTGVYNTQDIGLSLYKSYGALSAFYAYKNAAYERQFEGESLSDRSLENEGLHQYANLSYTSDKRRCSLLVSDSDLGYENHRDSESDDRNHKIGAFHFTGNVGPVRDIHILTSLTDYKEKFKISYLSNAIERKIADQSIQFSADKTFSKENFTLLTGYQFERKNADIQENRSALNLITQPQTAKIERLHHGAFALAKINAVAGGPFWQNLLLEASLRHDSVNDIVDSLQAGMKDSELPLSQENNWSKTHWKISTSLDGYRNDLAFLFFLNYGGNTKFPTLIQQLSRAPSSEDDASEKMHPETLSSLELGMDIFKESLQTQTIDGWHLEASFFRNYYENKFIPYSAPGSPILFYDNIPIAEIFGVEGGFTLHFYQKKMNLKLGISRYNISDKLAFPFKSDLKQTIDWRVEHAGFSFILHWFNESEQIGWLRTFDGQRASVTLPAFSNIDLHCSKLVRIYKLQFFVNLSGMNLLNSPKAVLQGLSIRDRRAFLTAGFQF